MAFDITNSIRYTGVETADTAFSKVLIANLFKNSTFKAGVTYTDKYYERAGQIFIRRLGKTAVTKKDATAAGGLDFTHTQTADKLLTIVQKDALSRSEKIYALIDELRASGKSVDKVAEVVAEWTEGFNVQCMSYLLQPVAAPGGGATRSPGTTASTNSETLFESILSDRELIDISGGSADVLIINPRMEHYMFSDWALGKGFLPETNESVLKEGKIGRLFGLNVYKSNLIGPGTPLDPGVAANTGDAANTEYVIYDHDTLGIASTIEGLRLVEDDKTFVGSFAQIMSVMGGIVANPALAIAKVAAIGG